MTIRKCDAIAYDYSATDSVCRFSHHQVLRQTETGRKYAFTNFSFKTQSRCCLFIFLFEFAAEIGRNLVSQHPEPQKAETTTTTDTKTSHFSTTTTKQSVRVCQRKSLISRSQVPYTTKKSQSSSSLSSLSRSQPGGQAGARQMSPTTRTSPQNRSQNKKPKPVDALTKTNTSARKSGPCCAIASGGSREQLSPQTAQQRAAQRAR